MEPELERTEFWQEQEAAERVEMRRHALRWLTLFLGFVLFLSSVLYWSTSVVQYGAARAAGTQPPTFELSGSIRDAQTGKPVSWALVADAQDDRKPPFFETKAESDGEFRLLTFPEPHAVLITARGYHPYTLSAGTSWYRWRPVSRDRITIRLEPE